MRFQTGQTVQIWHTKIIQLSIIKHVLKTQLAHNITQLSLTAKQGTSRYTVLLVSVFALVAMFVISPLERVEEHFTF